MSYEKFIIAQNKFRGVRKEQIAADADTLAVTWPDPKQTAAVILEDQEKERPSGQEKKKWLFEANDKYNRNFT